jgi:hypothetical protein
VAEAEESRATSREGGGPFGVEREPGSRFSGSDVTQEIAVSDPPRGESRRQERAAAKAEREQKKSEKRFSRDMRRKLSEAEKRLEHDQGTLLELEQRIGQQVDLALASLRAEGERLQQRLTERGEEALRSSTDDMVRELTDAHRQAAARMQQSLEQRIVQHGQELRESVGKHLAEQLIRIREAEERRLQARRERDEADTQKRLHELVESSVREEAGRANQQLRDTLKADAERTVAERFRPAADEWLLETKRRVDDLIERHMTDAEQRVAQVAEERIRQARLLIVGQVEDRIKDLEERLGATETQALEDMRRAREDVDASIQASGRQLADQLRSVQQEQSDRLRDQLDANIAERVRSEIVRAREEAQTSLQEVVERIVEEQLGPALDLRIKRVEDRFESLAARRLRLGEEQLRTLTEQGALAEIERARSDAETRLAATAERLVRERLEQVLPERIGGALDRAQRDSEQRLAEVGENVREVVEARVAELLEANRAANGRTLDETASRLADEFEERLRRAIESVRAQTRERVRQQAEQFARDADRLRAEADRLQARAVQGLHADAPAEAADAVRDDD